MIRLRTDYFWTPSRSLLRSSNSVTNRLITAACSKISKNSCWTRSVLIRSFSTGPSLQAKTHFSAPCMDQPFAAVFAKHRGAPLVHYVQQANLSNAPAASSSTTSTSTGSSADQSVTQPLESMLGSVRKGDRPSFAKKYGDELELLVAAIVHYKSLYVHPWVNVDFVVDELESAHWPQQFWGLELGRMWSKWRKNLRYSVPEIHKDMFKAFDNELLALGCNFDYQQEKDDSFIECCVVFHRLHGHFEVPIEYKIPDSHEMPGSSLTKNPYPRCRWGLWMGGAYLDMTNGLRSYGRRRLAIVQSMGLAPVTTGNFPLPIHLVEALNIYKKINDGSINIPLNFKVPTVTARQQSWPAHLGGMRLGRIVHKYRSEFDAYVIRYRETLKEAGLVWPDLDQEDMSWLLAQSDPAASAHILQLRKPEVSDRVKRVFAAMEVYHRHYGNIWIRREYTVDSEEREYHEWPPELWDYPLGREFQWMRLEMLTWPKKPKFTGEEWRQLGEWKFCRSRMMESRVTLLACFRVFADLYGRTTMMPNKYTVPSTHVIIVNGQGMKNPFPRSRWGFVVNFSSLKLNDFGYVLSRVDFINEYWAGKTKVNQSTSSWAENTYPAMENPPSVSSDTPTK